MNIGIYDTNKKFEYENGFYLTSEPYRLGNILAHYEIYKKIINLPGDIIELGVFKGGSISQFCTFRELLENEKARKIIGFDMFGKFPMTDVVKSDQSFVENWNQTFEAEFLSKENVEIALREKGFSNFELIQGNILETLDIYLDKNPHTRIAMLHIDTDVYEPAKYALDKLFSRVVRGGIVMFDDYATVEGETIAVDEFLDNNDYCLEKLTLSHTKPSFLIKK